MITICHLSKVICVSGAVLSRAACVTGVRELPGVHVEDLVVLRVLLVLPARRLPRPARHRLLPASHNQAVRLPLAGDDPLHPAGTWPARCTPGGQVLHVTA